MKVCDIGPPDAKIMLVGEAPGKNEAAQGRPFVGAAGHMLHQLLSHSGIDYNQCYVTNVVDERPPGNDFGFFYLDRSRKTPTPRLEKYWEVLREKIERISPNIVIALGGEALRALTGRVGITSWRGTPMSYKGIKVIATYHPSYIMKQYQHHPVAELDLVKAKYESADPKYCPSPVNIIIQPSLQGVLGWISNALSNSSRVAFDIETVGKHIRCISLATSFGVMPDAISIPFISFPSSSLTSVKPGDKFISFDGMSGRGSSYWSKEDEIVVLDKLAELFADSRIQKVGQNSICFDAPLIEDEFGIHIYNHYMDTMHVWHVLYPELPKSLSFLCSVLTNYPNYWTDKDTENDDSEWTYNDWDSIVTLDISYKMEKELLDSNLHELYFGHVHPLSFALSDASRTGVLIDKDARDKLVEKTRGEIKVVGREVDELAGKKLNANGHKQVAEFLYEELKFPTIYKRDAKTGIQKPTVDEEALRKLEKRYPSEKILAKIIEYRKKHKLVSTFLRTKVDEDGRMRTSYNPSGTKGARISSSKNLWGTGMNLQNIPVGKSRGVENIRHIFIAGDDNVFVRGDLVQAETMVVAHILRRLGDNTLYNLYLDPSFDIHNWMATFIFGKSVEEISYYERTVGKLGNHSGNYCAGPKVLQTRALKDGVEGIDYAMGKRILEIRHKAIPGLRGWWADVERKLRQTRTITTCLGRRRIFFGRLNDNATIRDAVSYEPQSTVGDVLNIIFRRLASKLVGIASDCRLILQVHDELVVECPENKADYVADEMQRASFVPLDVCNDVLVIPIDITFGKNWRDCHKK